MSAVSYWLNFLKCQKEIVSHKLKIYGISKKIDDNCRMIGEEVYLFSLKPKSHKSILSHSRVKSLLNEVSKDHEIIAETEKEIIELKEEMMGVTSETVEPPDVSEVDVTVSENTPKVEETERPSEIKKEDKE